LFRNFEKADLFVLVERHDIDLISFGVDGMLSGVLSR